MQLNSPDDWFYWGSLCGLLCYSDDKEERALGESLYVQHFPPRGVAAHWNYAGYTERMPLGPEAPEVRR